MQIYILDEDYFPDTQKDYTLEMCLDIAKESVVVFSYLYENHKFWACIDDVTGPNILIFGSSARQLAIDNCSFKNDARYSIIKSSLFVFER